MKLAKVFEHRNFWLGCGMFLIMWGHASPEGNSWLVQFFNCFGYGGVDVFIFASGAGCYYSLSRDPDILRFLKRRLIRLAPAYVCFIIPWMLWRNIAVPLSPESVLGNLFGLQFFVSYPESFNWYLSGLILYYVLTPYLKQVTDSHRTFWQEAAVLFLLVLVCVPFWRSGDQIMVILARLPVYYLGLMYGKMAKQDYVLTKKECLLHLLVLVTGWLLMNSIYYRLYNYLWSHGLYWYPFVLIIPGSCLFLSTVGSLMHKTPLLRWLYRLLELMGIYSFELYLVHSFLYAYLMPDIIPQFSHIPVNYLWLMTLPVVALGTFLLNRAAAFLSYVVRKSTARFSSKVLQK